MDGLGAFLVDSLNGFGVCIWGDSLHCCHNCLSYSAVEELAIVYSKYHTYITVPSSTQALYLCSL